MCLSESGCDERNCVNWVIFMKYLTFREWVKRQLIREDASRLLLEMLEAAHQNESWFVKFYEFMKNHK